MFPAGTTFLPSGRFVRKVGVSTSKIINPLHGFYAMLSSCKLQLSWRAVQTSWKKLKQHFFQAVNMLFMYNLHRLNLQFLRAKAECFARLSHRLGVSPSVCLSVRLSHSWSVSKRRKLGSRNFHCGLPQNL